MFYNPSRIYRKEPQDDGNNTPVKIYREILYEALHSHYTIITQKQKVAIERSISVYYFTTKFLFMQKIHSVKRRERERQRRRKGEGKRESTTQPTPV